MRTFHFSALTRFAILSCALCVFPCASSALTPQPAMKPKVDSGKTDAKFNHLPCAVSGTVRNAQGAAVPYAAVVVIETATGVRHPLTADAQGNYCAAGLPLGKYSITFTKTGLRNTRIDAVTIAEDRTALANATLPTALNQPKRDESEKIAAPSLPSPVTATEPAPPPAALPPAPSSGPKSGPSPGPGTGAGSGAGSGHAAPPDPAAALGVAEATWFAQLHSGSIIYDVPPEMTIAKPATVTVTINGYKAPIQPAQTGESAPAPLKVSEWMRVEATQPDNPDEFTISSDPSQNPQFVPIDSGATWSWTVTPNHIGSGLKLHFQAFVLYKDDTSKVQRALPSTERTVTVQAEGVGGIVHQIDDNFWTNPINWFKYMLPGGAGFAALVALISWWIKSRKKPEGEKTKQ